MEQPSIKPEGAPKNTTEVFLKTGTDIFAYVLLSCNIILDLLSKQHAGNIISILAYLLGSNIAFILIFGSPWIIYNLGEVGNRKTRRIVANVFLCLGALFLLMKFVMLSRYAHPSRNRNVQINQKSIYDFDPSEVRPYEKPDDLEKRVIHMAQIGLATEEDKKKLAENPDYDEYGN